ncbi:hypothetical protein CKAH01_03927 [Colletotrichum kahawae]|uniref:Uncharacterized protein n=1 Tax=Colletotrichum kahawae TaxID=34407 RepID=A0AAD9YP57_COLKA|nr:hypothetical protein CKAH01_03927 [Colletotrichum kahawae]
MENPWDSPDDAVSLAALFLHAFPQPPSMEWASDPNAAVTGGAHSPIADPPTLAAFRPRLTLGQVHLGQRWHCANNRQGIIVAIHDFHSTRSSFPCSVLCAAMQTRRCRVSPPRLTSHRSGRGRT